jgi:alkylation response protein AidB-like acyl-CoA dehydrogenase
MALADFFLNEDQKFIKDLARKIAREKIIPARAHLDENNEFPTEILKDIAKAGLFGIYIPEEYGGLGYASFENCLAIEELSWGCLGVSVSFAASGLGAYPFLLFGTEDQKRKYLPDIAKGTKLGAFGLTEANAGSDAGGIQTTAVKDGNYYILNGTKQWITNGGEAEIYTVIAMTNKSKGARGASGFIVEKGTPGFSFGKKEDKLGIRASATRELVFQDCRVHKDNLIGGKEGIGFIAVMKTFDMTRPGIGAQALGVGQSALDVACEYARERHQFGKPIISFQAIQHMLANMATELEASRMLVYQVAKYIDAGGKDFSKYSAMAKLFPGDMAVKVAIDALQVLGGYGYMKEYPAEKILRDAKILQIYEGTNQIQRNVIGQELIKEYAGKRS